MHPAISAICPTCKANISDADRACGQCGADVSVWPGVGRTPLILPGNPALSEDEVRRRVSPFRIVSGAVVGVAALFGALYLTSASEPDEPALLYATGTTGPAAALADSAPTAMVSLPAGVPEAKGAPVATVSGVPTSIDVPAQPVLEPIPAFVVAPSEVAANDRPTAPVTAPAALSTKPNTPPPTPTRSPLRSPAPVPPPRTTTAARPAPPVAAASRSVVATARPALPVPTSASAPVLRLTPLVSDSLRPGELLQLRWSVQDRATGRAVKADMEFTSTDASVASVDRRTGIVTARRPGRVRIMVDAGAGGETAVGLTVRSAATVAVALAPATETLQGRTEAARSTSVITTLPPSVPVVTPPATAVRTPPSTPPSDTRRDEMPSDAEIRSVVDRVIADVRRNGARNAQIMEFLADGDGHRVAMVDAPASSSAGNNTMRVSFELRLTKFDGGGRPVARRVPVSLTVDKRDNAVTSSAVSIGALRRQ